MYKKLASNTLAQILSKVVTALIALFLIAILTRTLPIELFWAYNKIYNYFAILAFLADLWLYTLIIREISSWKNTQKVLWNSLSLRIWLGIIICIWALFFTLILPWFWWWVMFFWAFWIALFTIVSLINSTFLAVMQAHMKMEYHFVSFVWGKIFHLLLIVLFSLWIFSAEYHLDIRFVSLFFAWFLSVFFTTYLNYRYVKKITQVKLQFDKDYIKSLFWTSLPYGIALFLSVVYFRADILLLGFLESEREWNISIALYSLPMKIVEVLMVLWVFYLNSLLPKLTEYNKYQRYEKLYKLFVLSFKILLTFWILLYVLSLVFAKDMISLLAHNEYLDSNIHNFTSLDVFWLVFLILIFHFIALLYSYLLIASEKQSVLLKVQFFVTWVNIIWNILLIPYLSFYGAAIVTLVTQILLFLLLSFIVWKRFLPSKCLLIQSVWSIVLWCMLYYIFTFIVTHYWLWVFWNIFIYWSIFLLIYIMCEYIFSKKFIKNLI